MTLVCFNGFKLVIHIFKSLNSLIDVAADSRISVIFDLYFFDSRYRTFQLNRYNDTYDFLEWLNYVLKIELKVRSSVHLFMTI